MSAIRSVCVFCSSSNRIAPHFLEEGKRCGESLAKAGLHVIFGGGKYGVMGAVAQGTLHAGGTVTGVYPTLLREVEPPYEGLTELITVPDMHLRKLTMFSLADAFLVLPGGFGTMDETFEVITWKQLQTHQKPIVIYNHDHHWDLFVALTDQFINAGFAGQNTRNLYTVVSSLDAALAQLKL